MREERKEKQRKESVSIMKSAMITMELESEFPLSGDELVTLELTEDQEAYLLSEIDQLRHINRKTSEAVQDGAVSEVEHWQELYCGKLSELAAYLIWENIPYRLTKYRDFELEREVARLKKEEHELQREECELRQVKPRRRTGKTKGRERTR